MYSNKSNTKNANNDAYRSDKLNLRDKSDLMTYEGRKFPIDAKAWNTAPF